MTASRLARVPSWWREPRRRLSEFRNRHGRRRFCRARIAGRGLEIGALDSPFPLPRGVEVTYVDRFPASELAWHYPEIEASRLLRVDLVADGETLAPVAPASQDFVVASHVLEHCQDPIGALTTWCRVVRPGGAILLAVPDRRFTFDRGRAPTPLAHLLSDHVDGGAGSRSAHYLEWVERVERIAADRSGARARELELSSYSIHFHVWDFGELEELLRHCESLSRAGVDVEAMKRNRSENLALLRRRHEARSDRLAP